MFKVKDVFGKFVENIRWDIFVEHINVLRGHQKGLFEPYFHNLLKKMRKIVALSLEIIGILIILMFKVKDAFGKFVGNIRGNILVEHINALRGHQKGLLELYFQNLLKKLRKISSLSWEIIGILIILLLKVNDVFGKLVGNRTENIFVKHINPQTIQHRGLFGTLL